MTNNQLCIAVGVFGCLLTFISMGLMFFGVSHAFWGAVAGMLFAVVSVTNMDD